MTFMEFVKEVAGEASPIGDLAQDILDDKDFPRRKSEWNKLAYIDSRISDGIVRDAFRDFLEAYMKVRNPGQGEMYTLDEEEE